MKTETMAVLASLAAPSLGSALVTDYNVYSRHWGQLSPYKNNADDLFGVNDVGVPQGCGLEQAHLLQRHAQRFGTSEYDDAPNDITFGDRVMAWQEAHGSGICGGGCGVRNINFSGPLAFLNCYTYTLSESVLTGVGASTEFNNGVEFWNKYGRLLYNATSGQVAYNGSFTNGTARPKPVLRTTSQSRIWNSQISWSLGFFGPSFQSTPSPTLGDWTDAFDVVVITEDTGVNNTLAAYDSCYTDTLEPTVDIGDQDLWAYLSIYLGAATKRLQKYVPANFTLTVNDTYAMQSICAYETAYIGESPFCGLFTLDEWAGFENTLDIEYYYDYTYGNPTGRAQGIGYLQELIARLTNQYIYASNSSINSTLTDNADDFPLGRPFYADFTHDDIILSVLAAMSLDFLRDPPTLTQWPPNPNRAFILSHLTPFGAHLVTEVYGCVASDPEAATAKQTLYKVTDTGYNAAKATNKFVRMRLNDGILPLHTIRGGGCAGRTDGLCALDDFLASQANATAMANYQFACFGNWTLANVTSGADLDGTIFA